MDKLFEIKNLNMHYPVTDSLTGNIKGYVYALNDVSLDIYKNEILGLVGESGSGKSTLGNCILKLIEPTSGEVIFENENILLKNKKSLKDFRKRAQLIFQNPYMSLNPRMKIYDILKEPLIINGIKNKKEIDVKIKKIINLVALNEDVLSRYPHEFSGGQRQRIAIARAIILTPGFILADEPVSALDVSIQAQIVNLLLHLKNYLNLTMLFISHDLSVIKYISDRIAVMYLGEIVEIANKDELFANPKHPYTEALLNAVPVISEDKNFGETTLKADCIQMNPLEAKAEMNKREGEVNNGFENNANNISLNKKFILKGDLPSPQNPPKGCKFHTRCPYAIDKCKTQYPKFTEISQTHKVRCFLAEK